MNLPLDPTIEDAIRDALAAVGRPGSFFTGAERVDFAAHARAARGLAASSAELPPIVDAAVSRVAVEAMKTRQSDVQAWVEDGRDVLAYVELVSVVAQVVSIDSYRIGMGMDLDPLPAPGPGDPVPNVHPDARTMNAWVPTVGIALAPTSLTALPDEAAPKKALASAWYIQDKVVHAYGEEPGLALTRPQMELVAARTSWLNECFF